MGPTAGWGAFYPTGVQSVPVYEPSFWLRRYMCRSAQLQLVKRMLKLPDPRTAAAALLAAAWLLSGSRAQPTTWSQDEDWLVHRPVEPSRLVEDEAGEVGPLTDAVKPDYYWTNIRTPSVGRPSQPAP